MSKQLSVDFIANIPYLNVLDATQQHQVVASAHHYGFASQALIFLEGEPATGLWIIETGQVKIARLNLAGDEYILHLLGPGDSFNDIAVLENGLNPASATALTDTTCWCIPTDVIQHILIANPHAARSAITMLTARVRSLAQQLEDLALYSTTARLARFLLQQTETPLITGGITRVAIAAHLATTPESISRALRHLEQAGAIQFNRHQIEIIRPDILQILALIVSS